MPVSAVFFDCPRPRGPRPAPPAAARAQGGAWRWRCRRAASSATATTSLGHGEAFYEAAAEQRARGHRRQAGGQPLHRRPHARLAEDQVPPAPGVRDRRLDRSAGRARLVRRAAPRRLRGRPARLRRARWAPASTRPRCAGCGSGCSRSRATTSPFDAGTPGGRGHHWVEPTLVCEVRFTEWTDDGGMRHPVFLGLRDDKRPRGVPAGGETGFAGDAPSAGADRAPKLAGAAKRRPAAPAPRRRGARRAPEPRSRQVTITNPNEGVLAGGGLHEGAIWSRYYETVAPLLLPYLRDRPLVLTRYPDGIDGQVVLPEGRARVRARRGCAPERIHAEGVERDIDYFVVDDVETLRYVANTGHDPAALVGLAGGDRSSGPTGWCSTSTPRARRSPTWWRSPSRCARSSSELELPSYPKTSRRHRPAHPAAARAPATPTRRRARSRALLATLAVEAVPAIATIARPIGTRGRQGLRRLRPERARPDDRRAAGRATAGRARRCRARCAGRR